jgi:hypothetical protein
VQVRLTASPVADGTNLFPSRDVPSSSDVTPSIEHGATAGVPPMQISHIEVRRHPLWQQEVHSRHLVDRPGANTPRRLGVALLVFVGMVVVCAALVNYG